MRVQHFRPQALVDPSVTEGRGPGSPRIADRGFSLVEILVVIVIVGVLATVAVFTVRGVTDRGETSALDADEDVLVSAEEAYRALNGRYATEAELVSAGFLRTESSVHDIEIDNDGSYLLVLASATTTLP
jgi:prepilin-type N-terminal cleavage/methylation domain-containing protein